MSDTLLVFDTLFIDTLFRVKEGQIHIKIVSSDTTFSNI